MATHCIFCDIINGLEPVFMIKERPEVIAILPKHMEVRGHALIIPKRHFQDIFDISGEVLGAVMALTRNVSRILCDRLNADGINMFHASGRAAQQSVGHFHIHIIPRFDGDNLDTWPDLPGCMASHQEILHWITG